MVSRVGHQTGVGTIIERIDFAYEKSVFGACAHMELIHLMSQINYQVVYSSENKLKE